MASDSGQVTSQDPSSRDRQRAWDYLLNLLSRQAYTVAELRAKLARRKVESALADGLIARLEELGLVDDKAFAEQYVESRKGARGSRALRAELRRKGVAEDIVEERIGQLDESQQLLAAVELLRKHAWRYRPDPVAEAQVGETSQAAAVPEDSDYEHLLRTRKAEAKTRAFLARRGFSPSVVTAAIDQVAWFET